MSSLPLSSNLVTRSCLYNVDHGLIQRVDFLFDKLYKTSSPNPSGATSFLFRFFLITM